MDTLELVIKIGSMALIRKHDNDIDYNILSRLSAELKPGYALISSGATEVGRLDYMKRTGRELFGDREAVFTDYSAQGQSIMMGQYRQFVRPEYSVRQILVEHIHFNDPTKRAHIRRLLLRSADQGAIPIINYNDTVSAEENRKLELMSLRENGAETGGQVVECVDNDETAAVIAELVGAKKLLILTSTEGIYRDANDPSTLVELITAKDADSLEQRIRELQEFCIGASRTGASGAHAKLEYIIPAARRGTEVMIGHSRHRVSDLLSGAVKCTRVRLSA